MPTSQALVPAATMPSVADIYRAVGIDYRAIDVDGERGTEYFDLTNSCAPEPEHCGAFDFVNDEGTIEHLSNPINGFQVTHELLKVGGVARHSMPLTGWQNHGYFCTTLKFYGHLMNANHYEFILGKVFIYPTKTNFLEDKRFMFVDLNGQRLTEPPPMAEAALYLMYRKTSDKPFRIPSDLPDDLPRFNTLSKKLSANFEQLMSNRPGSTPRPKRWSWFR